MTNWKNCPQRGLGAAIIEFKANLRGWWYSVGECERSCHASCRPTRESADIDRIASDTRFDSGFHADLAQPSTLADALLEVMRQAEKAMPTGSRGLIEERGSKMK